MKERSREEQQAIAESAERQMRRWLMAQQIDERLEHDDAMENALASRIGPYIAISRESGSGGGEIARLAGEKLGWEVLDKKLLDYMAERYHMPRDMLEFVDETTANWMHEAFGQWVDKQLIDKDAYVSHLGKIVLLAAQHGRVILVGRGAQFLLPRDTGLTIRIIAPESYRIEQIMRRRGFGREQAKRYMDETDRGRNAFVQRYFHHNVAAPEAYDIVINTEKLGPEAGAALIVQAFESWSKGKGAELCSLACQAR